MYCIIFHLQFHNTNPISHQCQSTRKSKLPQTHCYDRMSIHRYLGEAFFLSSLVTTDRPLDYTRSTHLVIIPLSISVASWLVHAAGCLFKVLSPDPFDQPPAKLRNQLTAPAVHDIALEVGGEGVGERLTSIYIATTEHSSSMTERDVVVIWYDLKLSESNTIVESYGREYTM